MTAIGAASPVNPPKPTGSVHPGAAGRDRLKHALALLLPATLFGFLVAAQWQGQQERSSLAVRYNAPLTDAAFALQNEQNTLKAQLQALRKRLDEIQSSTATQTGASSELESRILDLKAKAGLTAITGDGVVIQLDDARATSASAKDLDKSTCHSTDLTDIINTAWRGGATAIAVNGQRVAVVDERVLRGLDDHGERHAHAAAVQHRRPRPAESALGSVRRSLAAARHQAAA